MFFKKKSGFTLVQLIIAMTIFLVLAAAVFLWIDPLAKVGEAKNKKRTQDISVLAAALANYAKENDGMMPVLGTITTSKKVLCSSQSGSNLSCDGNSAVCLKIDDNDFYKYIAQLPYDPDKSSSTDSGYYITKDASENLTIGACDSYDGASITQDLGFKNICSTSGGPAGYGGGHCWYLAASANLACDAVCSARGLSCVRNARYGPDVDGNDAYFCALNKSLSYACSTSCTAAATGTPAFADSSNNCGVQSGSVICSQAAGSGNYAMCPCQ